MAKPLLVVGLSGRTPAGDWEPLLSGRTILARCRQTAERALPDGWSIAVTYDELFDNAPLEDVAAQIADDIIRRIADGPVVYLVPGPGWLADATVDALRLRMEVEIAPGVDVSAAPAHTQITDALTLAVAQEQSPFDAGISPLDATNPTMVFNWHGSRVINLAGQRIRDVYGLGDLPAPDSNGTLLIPARDPLDSPPSFAALEYITARLRRPDGCPWDREQTHESLLDDFASEVAEYAEAVRAGDWPHAAEELGDVMLNVLMQAQIGTEAGHFTMADVLTSITSKLVRRHPHVFAGVDAQTPEDVLAVWNSVKAQERS
jgi:uncharacterized protein YabN with tetrapyrrole methylase and pyrophosphatase domain